MRLGTSNGDVQQIVFGNRLHRLKGLIKNPYTILFETLGTMSGRTDDFIVAWILFVCLSK